MLYEQLLCLIPVIIIIIIIIIIGLFQDKNIAVKDWIAFLNNIGVMCKKEQDIQYKKICKRKKKLKVLHMGTNIYNYPMYILHK